jgi:signal peptidase I
VDEQPRTPIDERAVASDVTAPAVESFDAGEPGSTPAADAPADTPPVPPEDAAMDTSPAPKKRSTSKTVLEWVLLIASALIIALIVKAFLFQAFYIPSDSMVPTLKTNDRVIVNKLSYKAHPVHRGDIIVFTTPKGADGKPIDPTIKDLVKRVIGLPGETVSEKDGHILINGKPIDESYLPAGTISDCASFVPECFPSGPLPPDRYWVMGDNRTGSRDSRSFGAINKSSIAGRVFLRIWPLNRLGIL